MSLAKQYDVPAAIEDFADILESWHLRGKAVRDNGLKNTDVHLDLGYSTGADETLDLFMPRGIDNPPLLVFLHGGFWRRLHKNDFAWIAEAWIKQGVAVAIVNYGLAPATALEEIVAQTQRALAWLWNSAAVYGFDAKKIVVSGHSAGGHLSAMAVACDWQQVDKNMPRNILAGAILISPIVDLSPLKDVPFLQDDLNFTDERIAKFSPVFLKQYAPLKILSSTGGLESEEFQRQGLLLDKVWMECEHIQVLMPDQNHLSICEEFANPESELFKQSLALITSREKRIRPANE